MGVAVVIVERYEMSSSSEEFARYAKAEQKLCDEAGPVLVAILRAIEGQTGLRVTEFRVTVDWTRSTRS